MEDVIVEEVRFVVAPVHWGAVALVNFVVVELHRCNDSRVT